MATSNHERVGKGLEALRKGLLPFVQRELKARYKARWWQDGVESALTGSIGVDARRVSGTDVERFQALDTHALLSLMWNQWNEVYHQKLGPTGRTYVSELRDVRNRWAHQQAFSTEDAYRALDTMTRLLEMVSAEEGEKTRRLAREVLRLRFEEEAKRELRRTAEAPVKTGAPAGLKPWRDVTTPHPDVASGRYLQAEFVADLSAVVSGEADTEYCDPLEFFRRTYLTEGLTGLLVLALQRLSGTGGEPVVDLQTSFGGGKTHSLLYLYHLLGGQAQAGQVPGLEAVMQQAKVTNLPRASRAVVVGQKFNPATPHVKDDGTEVHTLWGDLAWQLGGKQGYALVADADRKGVSPGSDTLATLLRQFGPALVLVDEWVGFLRNLHDVDGLPAGSFGANLTFAQGLTEAANRTGNALVVVTLPVSQIELGGPAGEEALEGLRKVVSRMAVAWKPASAEEGFEIVRRRLFQPISDFAARDAVCLAFARMYREAKGEFPSACASADYERRLKAAYPIHPELFDRLYEDWSPLERFQQTRGVLRLMAALIHELWERQDKALLIMPGAVPLDSLSVRNELLRYLPEGWPAVVDSDADGPTSHPLALDREVPSLGRYSACRRVSRTIFLGSAPGVSAGRPRGLEEVRIKLGCVQPGEVAATFGDALRRLAEHPRHLFSDGDRYWFDTHRNIGSEADDRAAQLRAEDVEERIRERLRTIRERGEFSGVHVAPESTGEVLDEQEARLVILGPKFGHSQQLARSPAVIEAEKILESRGTAPRFYKNMLVFLVPDRDRVPDLEQAVRQWMAWESVLRDQDVLNLDKVQLKQADDALKRADNTVGGRIRETYSWLLVPAQQGTGPLEWQAQRSTGGDDNIVVRASKKLVANQQLIIRWAPALLKMDLDNWLWKDEPHIGVKKLWEYLCTYLYLSRVRDEDVLLETIREGLRNRDFFGYAQAVDKGGRYLGLTIGSASASVYLDAQSVIVKPEVALAHLDEERRKTAAIPSVVYPPKPTEPEEFREEKGPVPAPIFRRFHGSVALDPTRVARDASRIAEEVVQHLTGLLGTRVEVTLEIQAHIPDGAPDHVVRTVAENCRTLKFRSSGFESE